MEKYINLHGFENTNIGNSLKHCEMFLSNLHITFYKEIPLIFIEFETYNIWVPGEDTHIFTSINDFILFLKKYVDDNTSILYENLQEFIYYYDNINKGYTFQNYFEMHGMNINRYIDEYEIYTINSIEDESYESYESMNL